MSDDTDGHGPAEHASGEPAPGPQPDEAVRAAAAPADEPALSAGPVPSGPVPSAQAAGPAPEPQDAETPAAAPAGAEAGSPPAGGIASAPAGAEAGAPPAGGIATSPASPDVDLGSEAAVLPGEHRGGFTRPPTAPIEMPTTQSGPAEDLSEDLSEELVEVRWAPHSLESSGPSRGVAAWALSFAVAGLAVSFFVGWGLPLGIVAVILSIVALRRRSESSTVGGWALALGILSSLYSVGWILWGIGHPLT